MKFALAFIFAFALTAFGQSGRVKVQESPTPTPKATPRSNVKYVPTQLPDEVDAPVKPPVAKPTPPNDDGVIKVESTLVPIPATVLDQNGRAITTLRLADFELKINGKPAEIGDISRSESPLRLAMLFDNSSSVNIAREFETQAAIKFFDRIVRPDRDLAALYSVATVTVLEQQFTKDVTLLTQAIQAFPPPVGATALLDGIIKAAQYLGEVQGRRVIVIVSDGDDTSSDSSLAEAVRALQVNNCQVYVVKTTDFENYKRTGTRGGNANIHQLAAERRMLEVANQTGGRVFSPLDERELDEAFRQISADLTQQYILSYYPLPETDKRGEFREITLTIKGKPDVDVRTRKGYYVPKK